MVDLPENVTPEQFEKIAPILIKEILQGGERGYKDEIDDVTWEVDGEGFAGRFTTGDDVFGYSLQPKGDEWERDMWVISGVDDDGEAESIEDEEPEFAVYGTSPGRRQIGMTPEERLTIQQMYLAGRERQIAARELAFSLRQESLEVVEPLIKAGKLPPGWRDDVIEFRCALGASEPGGLEFSAGEKTLTGFFDKFLHSLPTQIQFSELSGTTLPTLNPEDPRAVAAAAIEFQAEQRMKGITITASQAVKKTLEGMGK